MDSRAGCKQAAEPFRTHTPPVKSQDHMFTCSVWNLLKKVADFLFIKVMWRSCWLNNAANTQTRISVSPSSRCSSIMTHLSNFSFSTLEASSKTTTFKSNMLKIWFMSFFPDVTVMHYLMVSWENEKHCSSSIKQPRGESTSVQCQQPCKAGTKPHL